MQSIAGAPLAFWIGFHALIAVLLALDLGLLGKELSAPSFRKALTWTGIWIGLALAFGGFVHLWFGREPGTQFLAGYLLEESLSVDNLFLFLVVFHAFGIERRFQHRVLFWGVVGAIAMRAIFIAAGISLIRRFWWVEYLFGAVILIAAARLLFFHQQSSDEPPGWIARVSRYLPLSSAPHDGKFLTGTVPRQVTTLLLALIAVEVTDLIFAVDSIPAVISISRDPFIVYTSNIFAILGLRSLFFCLSGAFSRLRHLHYGLGAILAFVGVKMIAGRHLEISTLTSLAVILTVLAVTIAASFFSKPAAA